VVVDCGPNVKIKKGERVIVSFNIACGQCEYCKRQEFTACDITNPSQTMERMYGHRCVGMFGYSHITGGYAGGQAEFVRVPFADVNCLVVPDDLKDEQVLFLTDAAATVPVGLLIVGIPCCHVRKCQTKRSCRYMGSWSNWALCREMGT
jgi:threonine dehydrogenase-like Zn-dependent dehydrogenase